MNTIISQALATGLPVITTYHSGLPDQVKDRVNGFLVREGDYEALAERIIEYAARPETWAEMSRQARIHVMTHYNADTHIRTQIDWYRRLLNG